MTAQRAIAIVGDDDLVRAATASFVRSLGHSTQSFASAREFLNSEEAGIAFVISDLQMPGMSGIELQRQLKKRTAPPPLLLMTAFPSEHLSEQARAAGAVGLVGKPMDVDALIGFLDGALN